MRISLAQLNLHIGDFEGNLDKMRKAIKQAKEQNSDLICFPELATCGYPPRDFLEFSHFIELAEKSIQSLVKESHDIAIAVGSPSVNPVIEGKDLHNSAYFLYEGEIKHITHKALLPTYDIFDEYRYFEPGTEFETLTFKGKNIALTICEDIWNLGNENPLYTVCPLDKTTGPKADLVLNLSASPFTYNHAKERLHVLKANANRYNAPFFYVNHCGAQTELVFDGGSIALSPDGRVYDEMPYFEECLRTYDLNEVNSGREFQGNSKDKIQLIHKALVIGVRDYFHKLGLKKAILGLSGGIDSALTAALAAEALGPENILGVLMPSHFSSDHSVKDALDLANNLGITHKIISIEDSYQTMVETMYPHFEDIPFNVTEENIQARMRAVILMALSNKLGFILLNTSNKSEAAVGYGTLYGDMSGGLSVIGDVYKTEVFELSKYMNRDKEIIPVNTITKPPSAELRPDQKDSDSLPPYDVLDHILLEYIENRKGPHEIIEMGYDPELVGRILRLVNTSEFKRYQTPPAIRVSPKAFGSGRRMPIVAKYLS